MRRLILLRTALRSFFQGNFSLTSLYLGLLPYCGPWFSFKQWEGFSVPDDIPYNTPETDQVVRAIEQLLREHWDPTIGNIAEKLNLGDAEVHRWMADAIESGRVYCRGCAYFPK